jgi:ATP-binding cassette subfamily B protein
LADPATAAKPTHSNWGTLKKLLPYVWQWRWRVALALACLLIVAGAVTASLPARR